MENKISLTIDGTEYELVELYTHFRNSKIPEIVFGDRMYIGKAIPKESNPIIPDYAITHFLLINHNEIIDMRSFGTCHPNWYLDKPKDYSIHSVRRISDNEVFSIGGKYSYCKEGIITKFHISDIGEMLCDIEFSKTNSYHNAPLRAIDTIKIKIPILTTVDGVEKFEGDSGYYVNEDFKVHFCCYISERSSLKYFHDKQKAIEWKLNNKPIPISMNEIERWYNSGYTLKELFQSKIQTT